MKKLTFILITALAIASGCSPDPEASFTYSIDGNTVYFTNTSGNSDSYVWDFGDGYTSYEASPYHYYNSAGLYNVSMRAYGKNDKSDIAYANIDITTTLTIYNPLPTLTDFWLNDVFIGTIDAYSSWTVYDVLDGSVDIYAETWGETTDGYTLGEVLYWDFTEYLYGGSQDLSLTINDDFYYLFISNIGSGDLNPLYVNCSNVVNNPASTYSYLLDILIPNDGYEYNTGWFDATGYVNVAAYYDGYSNWVYWLYPSLYWDYDYYQYLDIENDLKKTAVSQSGVKSAVANSGNVKQLKPSTKLKSSKLEIPKEAIKHVSSGSKNERRSK
jgi:hypothetical protein